MDMHIRSKNFSVNEAVMDSVRRRLDFSLGRFDQDIRRVDVRLSDTPSLSGSDDKSCQLEVYLAGGGSLWIREDGHLFTPIIQRAARRLSRALSRVHGRKSSHAPRA